MIAEDYLRLVGFELRDLPWRMRRDLLSELRGHLDEMPAHSGLEEQLGTPKEYAADLRSAAGLERRRGLIAFVRARRPRNLVLVALAATVIGLAIGAVSWVDSYQPLATGNAGYGPLDAVDSPSGDGVYVVFHQGKPFAYGMTIWNRGRFAVHVLGVADFFKRHLPGLPASVRLFMSAPTMFDRGGIPGPYRPFHPFDLKPGEERGLIFRGVLDEPCADRGSGGGSDFLLAIPVRFSFLWRTATAQVNLPERLSVYFPKDAACPVAKP